MKKIFAFILILLAAFSLRFAASAEEAPLDIVTESVSVENYVEATENVAEPESNVAETVLERLLEFYDLYKTEIKTLVDLLIAGAFAGFAKHLKDKIANFKKETKEQISSSSKASNDKTNELIDAYNRNADLIGELVGKVDELIHKVEVVDKNTLETEDIEKGIARMLNAAFSRLKLPNGTKDVVGAELAQILDKGHASAAQEAVTNEDEKQD